MNFKALLHFILSNALILLVAAAAHAEGTPQEPTPFAEACLDPGALAGRPSTNVLIRTYARVDKDGRKASDYLGVVLGYALEKLENDLTFVDNLAQCHGELKNSPSCDELRSFTAKQVPQLIKDVRFHLALAQSPKDLSSTFGSTTTTPNYKMWAIGTVKIRDWERTTKEEYETAANVLKSYKNEIVQHYLQLWNETKYTGTYGQRMALNASLIQVRFQHFQQYRSLMAAAPFLQYFDSANPSVEETLTRFQEFKLNALKEKAYLQDLQAKLQGQPSDDDMDQVIASALQYSAYVEFALMDNPEFCGLAASLMYTNMDRGLGTSLVIGLPLLAASFFMPGIVAYPLGIVASAFFVVDSLKNYDLANTRAMSVLFLDPGGDSNQTLLEARNNLEFEVMLFPLSLVGGRFFGTTLRAHFAGRIVTDARLNGKAYLPKYVMSVLEKFSRHRVR